MNKVRALGGVISGFLVGVARALGLRGGPVVGALVGGLAISAFVAPFEGLRTEAYLDRIARPPVWTVCFGETRGVQRGDSYTPEECRQQLLAALLEYQAGLHACLPSLDELPETRQVALVSWTYNVGIGAACGSTLVRKANRGEWPFACDELLRWNRAGGREVLGLTRRRQAEWRLCMGLEQ